ncbi:MAG: WecB/TagA/CpsF family glycosyltransferase [Bacteroidota bacterium]
MTTGIRTQSLFAVRVHNAPYEQLLAAALAAVREPNPSFTAYSHFNVLLDARQKPWLHSQLNRAALNISDGIAVRLAFRATGAKSPANVNATDFHHALLMQSLQNGSRIFLLGGSAEAAEILQTMFRDRYPDCVVQTHHGQIDVADPALVKTLRTFAPDILFLGLGSPKQFEWIEQNLAEVGCPLTVATGNFLEFLAGTHARAPRWMQAAGFEWLHRLLHEPARLWRRYIFGIPRFAFLIIAERVTRRIGG